MRLVIAWIANSLAILFIASLLGNISVDSARDAFIAGAVLSVINAIVRPLLVILTLPFTIITLGLFYFVITGFCLWLARLGLEAGGWGRKAEGGRLEAEGGRCAQVSGERPQPPTPSLDMLSPGTEAGPHEISSRGRARRGVSPDRIHSTLAVIGAEPGAGAR